MKNPLCLEISDHIGWTNILSFHLSILLQGMILSIYFYKQQTFTSGQLLLVHFDVHKNQNLCRMPQAVSISTNGAMI